jgi:hypothetical protein
MKISEIFARGGEPAKAPGPTFCPGGGGKCPWMVAGGRLHNPNSALNRN